MHICQHMDCLRFHTLFGKDVNAFPNFLWSPRAAQYLKFFKSMTAEQLMRGRCKRQLHMKQALQLLHADPKGQAFGKELEY